MRRSILALVACLLVSGVVIVGCGGGDDESTTAGGGAAATTGAGGEGGSQSGGEASDGSAPTSVEPTSETKAEFSAKANAACVSQQKQLQVPLQQAFKNGQNSQQALRQVTEEAIGPAMEAEAEELRALGAPQGDEKQIEAIAVALDAIAAEARENPMKLVTDPSAFKEAQKLARGYGLDFCGSVA